MLDGVNVMRGAWGLTRRHREKMHCDPWAKGCRAYASEALPTKTRVVPRTLRATFTLASFPLGAFSRSLRSTRSRAFAAPQTNHVLRLDHRRATSRPRVLSELERVCWTSRGAAPTRRETPSTHSQSERWTSARARSPPVAHAPSTTWGARTICRA